VPATSPQANQGNGWTDDEIKGAITAGVSKDGSRLKPLMGHHYYATVTPNDLIIVAYWRTVPAVE
jgi:hypothetical protein